MSPEPAPLCIEPGLGLSNCFISQETSSDAALWSRTAAPWGRKEGTVCSLHGPGLKVQGSRTLFPSRCGQCSGRGGGGERPVCSRHPISGFEWTTQLQPSSHGAGSLPGTLCWGQGAALGGLSLSISGDGLMPGRMGRFLQAGSGVGRPLGHHSQSGPCPRGLQWL